MLQEKDEFGKSVYTIRSLAESLKKNKDHVDEHRALLRVPADVRQLIEDDPDIPVRVIRELGNVEDATDRAYLIDEVRTRNLKTADMIAILQQRKKFQRRNTAPSTSLPERQSSVTSASAGETVTVVEHERAKQRPPSQRPSTALALVVLERKLHKDQTQLQKTLDRVAEELAMMSEEEEEPGYVQK